MEGITETLSLLLLQPWAHSQDLAAAGLGKRLEANRCLLIGMFGATQDSWLQGSGHRLRVA